MQAPTTGKTPGTIWATGPQELMCSAFSDENQAVIDHEAELTSAVKQLGDVATIE